MPSTRSRRTRRGRTGGHSVSGSDARPPPGPVPRSCRRPSMRNVDERTVAQGGGGASARPLLASDRGGFVDRHELWTEAQYAQAAQMRRVIDELGLEMVRVAFADTHG